MARRRRADRSIVVSTAGTDRATIRLGPLRTECLPRVKIQEADAKSLLVAQGLPVPAWAVARHRRRGARRRRAVPRRPARGKVVIKAQVLVGGRGKAGGVKLAGSADEAEDVARAILGMDIKGFPVRKVLVGPAADIVKEYYLAAVLDRATRRILLMGSAEGGVEIEQVADERPGGDRPRSTPTRCSGCPTTRRASWRSRSGWAAHLEGRRRDRQGPRQDDARLRRRPRRDQPARDRPRARRRTATPSSGSSASTPRSPSTTPRSPATRASRSCATPTRRRPTTARRARPA